jgi:signal transduction histidine kinase
VTEPRTAAWGAAIALGIAAVGIVQATIDPEPASPLRHLSAVPVVLAGLRFGAAGGGLAAVAAVLLQTPRLFVHLEDAGLSALAVEDLVTVLTLVTLAPLVGVLASEARRQRARYETLVAAQRAVAGDAALPLVLGRLRGVLLARVPGGEVAIALRDGPEIVVSGGDGVAPGSAVDAVLCGGAPLFVPDAGGGLRPRRVLVVPLAVRDDVVGALAVERRGELSARERGALVTLGAHVALALENARLLSRQRHFTEELAQKVAAATRELQAADRAKSAFIAVASHDLRTPLAALLGFAELLVERPFAPDAVRRLAGIMRRETERLARIVDDLLDLSRLERGLAPRVRARATPVSPAIDAAVELLRESAPGHRIVVETAAQALPVAHVDPDALDRVLKNLLANAIKYSPPGTTVRVTARATAAGVEIAIADEGRGIPADALPRVFEPYYRAPGAGEAASGLGLGLAVVKALVEAHGGTIRVESRVGTGTCVSFTLPALP